MKKEEDAAKEAFDGGTFAQFLACLHVGGKHERFFWFLGFQAMTATACKVAWIQEISRRPKSGGIQADDAGADSIQAHRPLKPRARKGRIMERFRGRAGRRWASPSRDRARCARGSRVRVDGDAGREHARSAASGSLRRQERRGGAIDDQVAGTDQPSPEGPQHAQHEQRL
jgi:hypothetical protein